MMGEGVKKKLSGLSGSFVWILLFALTTCEGAKFTSIYPNYGSLNGETRLTITGTGFPKEHLQSQDDDANVGTKLYLMSESDRVYPCRIHIDGCTETLLTCYTPKGMRQEDHSIKINVDSVPVEQDCPDVDDCTFKPHIENTPVFEVVSPQSGFLDGTVLTATGIFYTDKFGSNTKVATNGKTQKITRLYINGKNCELKPEGSDEFYLLTLDNEDSNHGTLKCNTTGKSVGCFNLSMIVEPPYGRSMSEVQRLSENDDICMFVGYAAITSLETHSGSTEGGQILTIYGKYFDQGAPYPNASVYIDDTKCEVTELRTDEYIKCVVGSQSASSSGSSFLGNRGVRYETWSKSISSLASTSEIRELTSFSSGHQQSVIDETYVFENATDDYVSRLKFYFVPKHSGTYTFYLLGDDYAELFMNDLSVVSSTNEWTRSTERTLTKDHKYLMEVIHYDTTGVSIIHLKVKFLNTNFTANYTNAAVPEHQKFIITSVEKSEEQEIEFKDFVKQTNLQNEILTVKINITGTGKFRLGLRGVYTEPVNADEVQMAAAINKLPLPGVNVIVRREDETTFQIEFTDFRRGDFRTIDVIKVAGGPPVYFTVVQQTPGIPDLDTVALTFAGVDSDPFTLADLTEQKLETAVNSLFAAKCPDIFQPSTAKYKADYEDSGTDYGFIGSIVKDSEPFCGRKILKNPYRIYMTQENSDGIAVQQYQHLCFAYKGYLQDYIHVKFTYKPSTTAATSSDAKRFTHTFQNDSSTESKTWYYTCVNLYDLLMDVYPSFVQFRVTEVRVRSVSEDQSGYVDAVYIGQNAVTDTDPNKLRRKAALPNDSVIDSVSVSVSVQSSGNKYNVILKAYECGTGFPLFRLANAVVSGGSQQPLYNEKGRLLVNRLVTASPAPTGLVKVQFNGHQQSGLNISHEPEDFKRQLETIQNIGSVSVAREGDCANFNLSVTFVTLPGNQEEIQVLETDLQGSTPSVALHTERDGGVFYDPIPGGLVRTVETKPQVSVKINNVLTACNGDCSYEWLSSATPTVTSVSPSTVSSASSATISIIGTGFSADETKNSVTIGGVSCPVTSSTSTSITCTVGNGPSGSHKVLVNVDGIGYSSGNVMFTYTSSLTGISPISGSLGGGVNLTISGYGFKTGLSVSIGGNQCTVYDITLSEVKCIVPGRTSAGAQTVTVTQGSVQLTYDSFEYKESETPRITNISPQSTIVFETTITIDGQSFTSTKGTVSIGGKVGTILSWSDTQIRANFTAVPAGTQELRVMTGSGFATNSSFLVPTMPSNLIVSNVYPREGSIQGGTNVTITGQGFGTNASLASVSLGDGVDCLIDEITATQIKCQITYAGRRHPVSNNGISQDYGIYYAFDQTYVTINAGDTIDYTVYTPEFLNNVCHSIIQVNSTTDTEAKFDGFRSSCMTIGQFSQTFTIVGEYYIWSGYVDPYGIKNYYMTVKVNPPQSSLNEAKVRINGVEALNTDTTTGGSNPSVTPISSCNDNIPTSVSGTNQINFAFWTCSTPKVTLINPRKGTVQTQITITGRGFSSSTTQNEVRFGDLKCNVISSNDSTIICKLLKSAEPELGLLLRLSLNVHSRGDALIEIMSEREKSFGVLPNVEQVIPSLGSQGGGARVTLTGFGYGSFSQVSVGGITCQIRNSSYTLIIFETPSFSSDIDKEVIVTTFVNESPLTALCDSTQTKKCNYTYSSLYTPRVDSISPSTTAGNTAITILGSDLGTSKSDIEVTIGEVAATDLVVTETSIEANIGNIPAGDNDVIVRAKDKGRAAGSLIMTGSATINNFTPSSGSIFGGTNITIRGNGFVENKTTVKVDGDLDCEIISVTLSEVVCTTKPHAAGDATVVVISNEVTYPTTQFSHSTASTPTVDVVSPSEGLPGDELTITGSNLDGSAVFVTLDNAVCVIETKTSTEITCTLGNHATGRVFVSVLTEKGLSNTDKAFEYQLAISNISPIEGGTGGKQTVTVTGKGFNENATVTICNTNCEFIETTSTVYQCSTPARPAGQCDVTVSLNDLTGSLTGAYTYNAAQSAIVSTVSPKRGGTGGGTSITIVGTGFGTEVGAVSVNIAGSACEPLTVESTKIVCMTGAHNGSIESKVEVQISQKGKNIESNEGSSDWSYIDVWSSPFTWGGGSPPEKGDFVVIPEGMTLLLDTDTPVLDFLLIQGGKLIFDEMDIELMAKAIMVTDGGLLQIGTESEPFQHKAIITMHGHVLDPELPVYGTKVIAIKNGTLDLHGISMPDTWTKLAETASAGSNIIELQNQVSWNVGDEIVIASTGNRHSQNENEKAIISAISPDNRTLTLQSSLEHTHLGKDFKQDGFTAELRGEVGLLTHNVVVRGDSNPQWEDDISACEDGFDTGEFVVQTCFQGRHGDETGSDQFGVMILIHAPINTTNKASVKMSHVEVTYAGQAFRLGRYPIHFHLNGNMSGSYVKGCSIHHTFNRAINIHGTSNILLERNVGYNIMGGSFFLEDGIETENIIQENLVIFSKASSSLQNDDITPAAFWITNPNNVIVNNAAAGGTHFGYWYRMHDHPEGPSFNQSICPVKTTLGRFDNNTAHSFGWFGLWIFPKYYPQINPCAESSELKPAVFTKLVAWNCEKGLEFVDGGALQFKECVLVNNEKAGLEGKRVIDTPSNTDDFAGFYDSLVAASAPGIIQSDVCTTGGIVLPYGRGFRTRNVTFVNFDAEDCVTLRLTRIDGTCNDLCGGYSYPFESISYINSPKKGSFDWTHEGVLNDIDGTATGESSDWAIMPTTNGLPTSCKDAPEYSHGKVKAKMCPSPYNHFHRFAFHKPLPSSLAGQSVLLENENGITTCQFAEKRLTHKTGWVCTLVNGGTYTMKFEHAAQIFNISFTGVFENFQDDDYVIIIIETQEKPDRFSIDGGASYINQSESLDPSTSKNGDFTYEDNKLKFIVSAKQRGDEPATGVDRPWHFTAFKCYYPDCIPPPDKDLVKPSDERQNPFYLWENITMWNATSDGYVSNSAGLMGSYGIPKTNDNVKIMTETWVVVNKTTPYHIKLKVLYLEGVLEFFDAPGANYTLEAEVIFITCGGRLLIGWPDDPFDGLATIVLNGNHSSPNFDIVGDGPVLGTKAIGVFGGLDVFGKSVGEYWTELAVTATKGTNTITVAAPVQWSVGSEIVVGSTDFDPWHTETFKITETESLPNDRVRITLNETLSFTHTAHHEILSNGKEIKVGAAVGLLTRNIKIVGQSYDDLYKESFGARVLVGLLTHKEQTCTGYARLANVEFYHTGQEGFTDDYDPRFSLTFLGVGEVSDLKPSNVNGCSFNDGFNTAIGVYGTGKLNITNNVIYRPVGNGLVTKSDNTRLINNLLVLIISTASYQDRYEAYDFESNSGVEAMDSTALLLRNNLITASERIGYHVPPHSAGDYSGFYEDNSAYSNVLAGVLIEFRDTISVEGCAKISNFTVWRSHDFAIYYQNTPCFIAKNNFLIENQHALFSLVIEPPSTSHEYVNKTVQISNNTFVGITNSYDCNEVKTPKDDNYALSSNARVKGPNCGILLPSYAGKNNGLPSHPFPGSMSYPALGGLTIIYDNTFAKYKSSTCPPMYALSTNSDFDDLTHPVYTYRESFIDVEESSIYFNHRPNIGKINGADCVDMECDGHKKVLIKDLDGTLIGSVGHIIPDAGWEWDGDPRRGLGDYRIPKTLLTDVEGNRIQVADIAPHKGIYGFDDCIYHDGWQAYACTNGVNYEMLIIESMDTDTETRRLSPVAILGGGYIDLLNGPQDHGWCSGYTCRKRVSTFFAIVATGTDYRIHLTSKAPKHLRFRLLNVDESKGVRISFWYAERNRKDIYVDSDLVRPTNHVVENGKVKVLRATDELTPGFSNVKGSNMFKEDTGDLVLIVKGSTPIDVKTIESVIVTFGLPDLTVEEFFGDNIIENLATFLNIPLNKVKVMNVSSAAASKRRKRSESTGIEVVVEIGDDAQTELNGTADDSLSYEELTEIASAIVNECQVGDISSTFNISGSCESVVLPSQDTEIDSIEYTPLTPDHLIIVEQPLSIREGILLTTQPKLRAADIANNIVTVLGTAEFPWQLTASIRSGTGHPNAVLGGTVTIEATDGWFNFTDLVISHMGTGYILEFNVTYPVQADSFLIASSAFDVQGRSIEIHIHEQSSGDVVKGSTFSVTLDIQDSDTKEIISDIAWRDHTWTASASILGSSVYADLTGFTSISFDTSTGKANFPDLEFTGFGVYYIQFHVVSNPPDFDMTYNHKIVVKDMTHASMSMEAEYEIRIKFDVDFNDVLVTENDQNEFEQMIVTEYANIWPGVHFKGGSVSEGSILVTFVVEGPSSSVEETVDSVCESIQNDTSYTFNGQSLTLSQYMVVNGEQYYGVKCGDISSKSDDGMASYLIAIIVIVCILVVVAVIGCIFVLKTKKQSKGRSPVLVKPLSYNQAFKKSGNVIGSSYFGMDKKEVEDYIFRDASFTNIIGGNGDRHAPPVSTKMAHSEHFQTNQRPEFGHQRPESGHILLTSRPHSVNIKVSELLGSERTSAHSNNSQSIWSTGNELNVPGMNLLDTRPSSPTGRGSPMLHRARTPVMEIENQMPPVGEATEKQLF